MLVVDNHFEANTIAKDGIATAILQGNRTVANMGIAPQGKRCFGNTRVPPQSLPARQGKVAEMAEAKESQKSKS